MPLLFCGLVMERQEEDSAAFHLEFQKAVPSGEKSGTPREEESSLGENTQKDGRDSGKMGSLHLAKNANEIFVFTESDFYAE